MEPGRATRLQLLRLGKMWKQGEHILVSGATGSGKTELIRHILAQREARGGHIIIFGSKTKRDSTLTNSYLNKGYTRYGKWPKRGFPSWERRIVLWPNVDSHKGNLHGIIQQQKDVFGTAFERIFDIGHYTVLFDDGLWLTHPQFVGMGTELAGAHAMGRSGNLTCVTACQRPSNLPLILYGSADHAFVGSTREESDKKRLAELQADESSKELQEIISRQGKHDFRWIPARHGGRSEHVNLKN